MAVNCVQSSWRHTSGVAIALGGQPAAQVQTSGWGQVEGLSEKGAPGRTHESVRVEPEQGGASCVLRQ